MSLPHSHETLANARRLRREMTPEERHLWYDFLRGYPVKVKRQKPIGPYVADFVCEGARLVMELDGSQHFEEAGQDHDAARTRYLEGLGLQAVRYTNLEVRRDFRAVCEDLDRRIQARRRT